MNENVTENGYSVVEDASECALVTMPAVDAAPPARVAGAEHLRGMAAE